MNIFLRILLSINHVRTCTPYVKTAAIMYSTQISSPVSHINFQSTFTYEWELKKSRLKHSPLFCSVRWYFLQWDKSFEKISFYFLIPLQSVIILVAKIPGSLFFNVLLSIPSKICMFSNLLLNFSWKKSFITRRSFRNS